MEKRGMTLQRASSVGVLMDPMRGRLKAGKSSKSSPALLGPAVREPVASMFSAHSVTIPQQPDGCHGIIVTFSGTDHFISEVSTDLALNLSQRDELRRGQKVLSINGMQAQQLNSKQVQGILAQDGNLTLEVIFDPDAFAEVDSGHELRRVSQCVFDQLSSAPTSITFTAIDSVRYIGAAPLKDQSSSLQSISEAFDKVHKAYSTDKVLKVILHVTNSEVSFVSKYSEETIKAFAMSDLITTINNKRMIAIVVRGDAVTDVCHFLHCKSDKQAEKLRQVVVAFAKDSFAHLPQAGFARHGS
eukprot:m.132423 g.132423  ORF g.132423 m.132423 type:complete len:301 (-) comp16485_c0_seq2:1925-2827(-)